MNKLIEKIYLISLFDIYSNLLSTSQKETFNDYYCLDLSLKEIAENNNVSRSAVEDCIKKCKKKLMELENSLKIYSTKKECISLINDIKRLDNIDEIKEQLDLLERKIK